MKNVYCKIVAILAVLCMLFTTGSVFAGAFRDQQAAEESQFRNHDRSGRPQCGDQKRQGRPPKEEMIQKMIDELGLSEEQVELMKQNKEQHREQAKILRETMKQVHEAIRTELLKQTSDEKTINRLSGELKAVQAEMIDHRIEGLLTLKSILTPEQFAQFTEKTEKAREKFSQFREKMGEHHKQRRGVWHE